MSIFNPGATVDLNELRAATLTWINTVNVTLDDASNHYHGAPNDLGWFASKNFRKMGIINTYTDTAGISPLEFPTVSLLQPYTLTSGSQDGAFINPKLISHNNYTVQITANTPYGKWVWSGWYTGANGSGTLITSTQTVTLGSASFTSTLYWYAYHVTFGGTGIRCLDGDSNVLLATGEYKKVKDLQAGELLMSAAIGDKPNTGYENDMESYMNWNDHVEMPEIAVSNSLLDSIERVERKHLKVINGGLLKLSLDHPVLVRKGLIDGTTAWTVRGAFNIEAGDILLATNGEQILVESAEVLEGNFELYDLRVVGNDTIAVNDVATIVQI